jgi:hypothetical protein
MRIKNVLVSSILLDWDEDLTLDENFRPAQLQFVSEWKFRNDILLKKYRLPICDYFSLNDNLNQRLNLFFEKIDRREKTIFGIHIRQGDYKHFEGGKYYYELYQYHQFLDQIESIFGRTMFIIATNIFELTVSDFQQFDVVMAPGDPYLDLYALSRCDYVLGPPSTFSLWASYFGEVPLYLVEDPKKKIQSEDFQNYNQRSK